MTKAFEALLKQPYWIIALIFGALLVAFPSVTIDKDNHWQPHAPSTYVPVIIGILLLILSALAFGYTQIWKQQTDDVGAGVDLKRVTECDGGFATVVNGCEIRVVTGRIEEYAGNQGLAVVLPCSEYFDDLCVGDMRSALGSYVNRVFDGRSAEFISLVAEGCRKKFGAGVEQQKTHDQRAASFGAGSCLLLIKPLGHSVPVALLSTATQRAGQGLAAQISYMFEGMRELVTRLADERINQVVMPMLGTGHGRIDPPLALVGLLLAIAEAARYGQGGQRLKRVTVVLFKKEANSPAEVDPVVVRRALALIGSRE
jgi:hypothetical protein